MCKVSTSERAIAGCGMRAEMSLKPQLCVVNNQSNKKENLQKLRRIKERQELKFLKKSLK